MRSPEIVVGVDGSPASHAALLWAAHEAVQREAALLALHVYDWRVLGARAPIGGEYAKDAGQRAEALVAEAVAEVRAAQPGLTVRGEARLGAVAPTLVSAAAEAQLLVVGSRGRGGFASLLLGSVSQQVATHASAPVVVVRGHADAHRGPVVVGVDGSVAADHALHVALETAAASGAGVVAVRVYSLVHPWSPDMYPMPDDEDRGELERKLLEEDVAAWHEKFPQVPLECVVTVGHPAEVLVGLSANTRVMVVGTRGHGGFAGLLLGSAGLQLLHHADCPVLIAHDTGTSE